MRAAWSEIGAVDPKGLLEARLQAHHAAQWVTRAARANLPAKPDDSHSNLGWEPSLRGLASHKLAATDGSTYRCGIEVEAMTLFVVNGAGLLARFEFDGRVDADAGIWIDGILAGFGLRAPGAVKLPYDIPAHPVASGGRYSFAAEPAAFAALARWFDAAADILGEVRSGLSEIGPEPSAIRCWPHHFDIATLLSLGADHSETAAAIGIGMSPGDAYYPQPYFYVSPWPVPPVDTLPSLPDLGRWHTQGFVGAVATGEAVLVTPEARTRLIDFIDAAVGISRKLLASE